MGEDLERLKQSLPLSFRQSVAHLQQELTPDNDFQLLEHAHAFYQLQLHRYPEAARYLQQRGLRDPDCIEELDIGYAHGGLRSYLATLGCSFDRLLNMGLINDQGRDAFCQRVIFPCRQDGQIINPFHAGRMARSSICTDAVYELLFHTGYCRVPKRPRGMEIGVSLFLGETRGRAFRLGHPPTGRFL